MQGFQRFGMKYWENCNGIALSIEKTEMERGKLPKKNVLTAKINHAILNAFKDNWLDQLD